MTLLTWKSDREATHEQALRGLREVTPDRLQEMLAGAMKDRDDRLQAAITRLEVNDAEAAQLLRNVLEELDGLRYGRDMDLGLRTSLPLQPATSTPCTRAGSSKTSFMQPAAFPSTKREPHGRPCTVHVRMPRLVRTGRSM